jgi:O-antigen ligase
VVLAMLVLLLVISNSMTALGSFVLASGLMISVSIPGLARRRALIHLIVLSIICLVFATLFLDLGSLLLEQLGRNPTLTGRTVLWEIVLAHSGNPVFGTGFESFWLGPRLESIWSMQWWRPNQAHNGYLEIYVTLGWIGIGLLGLVAIKGYLDILHALSHGSAVARLRLAFFAVAIAYNFTEAAFRTLHPVWLAFLLAVVVVPSPSRKAAEARNRGALLMRPPKSSGIVQSA